MFLKRTYKTLNLIKVSQSALKHNYHYFQTLHYPKEIAPVLKSNAYGHGLKLIGKFINSQIKPPFIAVDSLYEAYELQKIKVKTPILIMGYTFPENFRLYRKLKNFHFSVFDKKTLAALNKHQPGAKIHLKIDTDMNRLGIQPEQVKNFIYSLKDCPHLHLEGIYSHLSQADNPHKNTFTQKQITIFKKVIRQFEQAGFSFKWKHISATAGATLNQDPQFNLVRLGLGFYGYSPFPPQSKPGQLLTQNLKPALKLQSHLIQVKKIKKGNQVSYGGTFTAKKDITIGLIPIGYYDGPDRRLSNKGIVLINNQPCPVIGRICMNITIVDLSQIANPQPGQKAVIFSPNNKNPNSISQTALTANTIPYVLLVNLAESTKRVLV